MLHHARRLNPINSVRRQLLAAFIGLIIIGFGALLLLAGQQLAAGALEDFESNLQIEALLVASALHEPVEEFQKGIVDTDEVQAVVDTLALDTNKQIAIFNLDGALWIVSQAHGPVAENAFEAIEVQTALNQDVVFELRPNVAGENTLYSAAPIIDHDAPMAIARLTAPAALAQAAVLQRWVTLGVGFLAITTAALLLSLWVSASLTRPLRQLQASALQIAKGDFSQRTQSQRPDEIGDVSRAFNHMATQVETMLDEQRAFASNASHELRTPLTTMRLRIERLRSGKLNNDKIQKYSAEMEQELIRLTRLVEDLSILSRVDSQRLEIGQQQVDAKRVATAVIRELDSLREHQQQIITLSAPDNCFVYANMTHLRLVFRNILENALKYSPTNSSIEWKITYGDGILISRISDDGIGIEAEHIPRLFQRFYRVDKARNRTVPGSGLGLSLVKSVVELYHGSIAIGSRGLGRGTTVVVCLPAEQTDIAPTANLSLTEIELLEKTRLDNHYCQLQPS